uniref:AB hydrolase-1 domain-containing protein n=1 Tax=Caenorhabditis japonica TaxID=281687 RepID=A0A8R1DXE5_CAEJA
MATEVEKQLARQPYFDLNAHVKSVLITYKAGPKLDKIVTVQAGYVDICNKPDVHGTAVSLPGSPGSHNDIKYMRDWFEKHNIRLVCTNWPGSEFVTGGLRDSYTNAERNSYMLALFEKLELKKVEKLVLIGHSRGGESALQMASILSVSRQRLNGYEEETQRCRMCGNFYNDLVGLRVADGKVSAAAILPMQTFAFEKQKEWVDDMRKKPWIRMFYAYGSKDFLVAESDSEGFATYFKGDHFVIHDRQESEETIPKIRASYANGTQTVSANFTNEGHYLQKTCPEFLIQVVGALFEAGKVEGKQEEIAVNLE